MYTNSSRSYLKMASGTPRRTNGTPWRTGGTPTAEYSIPHVDGRYLINPLAGIAAVVYLMIFIQMLVADISPGFPPDFDIFFLVPPG